MKKRIVFIVVPIVVMLAVIVILSIHNIHRNVKGTELTSKLQQLDFSTVNIKVTNEDNEPPYRTLVDRELTKEELASFFEYLGATQLEVNTSGNFPIETPIQNCITFDASGATLCRLCFYGDSYVTVHFTTHTGSDESKVYKINSTTLSAFFDTFVNEA